MTDIATLGLAVDSRQVAQAKVELEKLTPAARAAEAAAKGLQTAASGVAAVMPAVAAAEQQVAAGAAAITRAGAPAEAALNRMQQHGARARAVVGTNTAGLAQLSFQLNDIATGLAMGQSPFQIMAQQGGQVFQIWQMNRNIFADAGRLFLGIIGRFPAVTALTVAAGAALVGVQHEINETSKKHVSLGNVALAAFQVVRDGVVSILKPAVDAIGPWFGKAWEAIIAGVTWTGNTIIGSFVAAFDDIKLVWAHLPDILGAAVIGGSNTVLSGVQMMVNGAVQLLNGLVAQINRIPGISLPQIGEVSIGKLQNPYADALQGLGAQREAMIAADMSRNYLGQFANAIKTQAVKNANAPSASELEKAAREAERLQKQWTDLLKSTDKQTASLRAQANVFGQSSDKIAEYTKRQELLNLAKENGINLTPEEIAAVNAAAKAYGDATGQLERLKNTQMAQAAISADVFDALYGWASGAKSAGDAIDDLTQSLLKMLAQAALTGNGSLSGIFGTTSSSGGIIGSILSAFGLGHNAGGTDNWRGGATWVGENGPEIVNLPRGAQVIPNNRIGGGANDNGGSSLPPEIHIHNAPAGTSATASQSTGSNGRSRLDITLKRQVDDTASGLIASGESSLNRELERRYSLRPAI